MDPACFGNLCGAEEYAGVADPLKTGQTRLGGQCPQPLQCSRPSQRIERPQRVDKRQLPSQTFLPKVGVDEADARAWSQTLRRSAHRSARLCCSLEPHQSGGGGANRLPEGACSLAGETPDASQLTAGIGAPWVCDCLS